MASPTLASGQPAPSDARGSGRGAGVRSPRAARRRRRLRRERGVALVMVIGAITILTVYLTEVQQDSTAALSAAIADRERLKAEYHARSAVNLSRLLIASEPAIRRQLGPILAMLRFNSQIPIWEFSDQVLGVFNDESGAQGFASLAGVDLSAGGASLGLGIPGRFELVVVDEDSKISLNAASKLNAISRSRLAMQLMGLFAAPQYQPLFERLDADGQHTDQLALCGAIIDWADTDEDLETCQSQASGPVSGGAEDSFYQSVGLPYLRKNAAYDSLEELRMVRGVGDDFWATFVEPDPANPKKRVMTVWGRDAVNVNTANAQTLWAVICSNVVNPLETPLCADPIAATEFLATVSLIRTFTGGMPLFGNPKDFIRMMTGQNPMLTPLLQSIGVQPVVFRSERELEDQLATESKMFSIYAEGVIPGPRRETRVSIHAVVDFRQASDMLASARAGANAAAAALGGGRTPTPTPTVEPTANEDLLASMNTNPAGRVVYFRIE